MGIDFTFKKNPFYVLLLMGGIALALFLFHLFTEGRYQKIPPNPFSGLNSNDRVVIHSSGEDYPIPPEKYSLLRTIDYSHNRNSLPLTGDHSLHINDEAYPLGIIGSPLPATVIKTPRGDFFVYTGHLLRDLGIPLKRAKSREQR